MLIVLLSFWGFVVYSRGCEQIQLDFDSQETLFGHAKGMEGKYANLGDPRCSNS